MVNEDNVISDYTMQTSVIESVEGGLGKPLTYNSLHVFARDAKNPTTLSYNTFDYGTGPINTGQGFSYADFGVDTLPSFGSGTGSASLIQQLAYWNGSAWIVDDKTNGNISNPNFWLKAKTPARYWVAFRSSTYDIGDTVNVGNNLDGTYFMVGNDFKDFYWITLATETRLQFADPNPDLKFFRPGDVVQSEGTNNPDWNETQIWSDLIQVDNPTNSSDPEKTFDGTITKMEGGCAITDSSNQNIKITLPVSYTNADIRVYFGFNGGATIWGGMDCGDKTASTQQAVGSSSNFEPRYAEVTGATGSEIVLNFSHKTGAGSSCFVYQYVIDNKILVDATSVVSVISTDLVNNTMVVDGGDQDTSNQSESWSNYLTSNSSAADSQGPGGFFPGAPRTDAFNGDVENTYTACTGNPAGDPSRTATITFDATGLGINIAEKVGLVMSATQDGRSCYQRRYIYSG